MTNLFLIILLNFVDNSTNETKYPIIKILCFVPILKNSTKNKSTDNTIPKITSITFDIFSTLSIIYPF